MRASRGVGWRIGCGVALALLTSGCLAGLNDDGGSAADDQQTGGPVTVEFWTINLKKDYGEYVQGLIDEFEREHRDISISWVDVPGEEIESKFLSALASDEVPDAVNIEDYRVDQFAGSLADLSPHFDDRELGHYVPAMVDSVRRDGRLLAIPWYNGGAPVAWYDTKLLDQAGLSSDRLPTSWEDTLEFGKTIAAETDTCAFNALPTLDVLMSYDAELLSADRTKANLNTATNAKVLDMFREAYRAGAICPGAVSEQERNLPQSVENGLAAGEANGLPFRLLSIQENAPASYDRLAVSRATTGSSDSYVLPGMQTFVVPEKSDVQAQAAEFIEWVTSPSSQLEFCRLVTIFPSTNQTLRDPYFTDIEVEDAADKSRAVVAEELADVRLKDLGTKVDVELDEVYLDEIRAFMTGRRPASDVLADVETEWNDLLAQR